MPLVTLLTDFGTADWYVAAVKGVILSKAPGTVLVDLSHEVPPGDVETASFLLAAAAGTFPAGTIHLAVVDPGVGSARRLLALERAGARFLAPDNGLLTPWLDGAATHAILRPDLFRAGPGATFHGRDRFAPAAAFLALGGALAELGPEVRDPVRLAHEPPRLGERLLVGRVAHIDRYGNLVTDLPAAWLPDEPFTAAVEGASATRSTRRRATHYAEIPPGEAAVLCGSLGTLELSLRGASLAEAWGIARGARVRVDLDPAAPRPG